ncbi:hydroxyacid dehydrogenase [Radiobacillus sp. PE A8.2]|uniref:hydroxyacid dehydrogenase n=1 Tax=Radiobacillus sp. PE A8.2 TaxID=3380349 RepID=UPI00388D69FA
MNILVTMPRGHVRESFIPNNIAKQLESLGKVTWNHKTEQFKTEEFREKLMDADVCITGWGCPKFDKQVLEDNNKLRLVAHTGGSVGAIMSDYLFEKNIKVISGNYLYAESVAESAIAYMLSSLRNIPFYSSEMNAGRWWSNDSPSEGLFEQRVGLVGFGLIAKEVVKMLKPFRNEILVYDPYIKKDDLALYKEYAVKESTLKEIFSTCKIISLHTALTPETQKMINKELLELIPEGAILINTARGKLIDESVLELELQKDRFKAALDVFEEEPLPETSKLRGLNNVILMPHKGGPTVDRRKHVTAALIIDIVNFFNNKPMKNEITFQYASTMTRKL